MRIFALGDPHLSFTPEGVEYKPMGIFGDVWQDHGYKIKDGWLAQGITEEDIVLLPGDISWAMTLEELKPDLAFLSELPGRKYIVKGNHDLWWESLKKISAVFPEDMAVLQNNSVLYGDTAICGTRGWTVPEDHFADPHDEKIFLRELARLRMSLETIPPEAKCRMVMMHYPPVNGKQEKSAFVELMEEFHVDICLYGHLHSYSLKNVLEGEHWGIDFQLVSADYLKFIPKLIREIPEE